MAPAVTYEILRDIAMEFPGVEEAISWGMPNLKVGKKAMLFWNTDHNAPVFKVPFEERDFLIEADPETFFTTDHHRPWPLVLARPDKLDIAWARNNLKRVWLAQVSKTILKAWQAQNP